MRATYGNGLYIFLVILCCIIVVGCGSTKAQKGAAGGAGASVPETKPSVKATTPGTHDVTLTWDDVPGATSYNIYWSDQPGVNKKNGSKISNAKNPHKIAGLKKGKKYYFVVTAVNASGESKGSEEFSITVGQ